MKKIILVIITCLLLSSCGMHTVKIEPVASKNSEYSNAYRISKATLSSFTEEELEYFIKIVFSESALVLKINVDTYEVLTHKSYFVEEKKNGE